MPSLGLARKFLLSCPSIRISRSQCYDPPVQFTLGNARFNLLSDGVTYGDGAGPFGLVPRPKWTKLLAPDAENRVPMALWCGLLDVDGKKILIDTGAGNKDLTTFSTQYFLQRPNGTLIDDLARAGVSPEQIDIVIQTHLHGDHCGWATRREGDAIVPTFPNARYYVQRADYDDATHPNERTRNTYFQDNFLPLAAAGVLTQLDGDAQITLSVRVVTMPGHCAGLQGVLVQTGARPLLFVGDLAPYAIHFARTAWVAAYDVLPLITIETKRRWQAWALDHNPLLVFAHDTRLPIGSLVKSDKGFHDVVKAEL
jgi:glyoxylase-like metal-dependent hydrolase (beta-lactamase superfamily II)